MYQQRKKVFKNVSNVANITKKPLHSLKRTLQPSLHEKKQTIYDENECVDDTRTLARKIKKITISDETKGSKVFAKKSEPKKQPKPSYKEKVYDTPAQLPANVFDHDKQQYSINNIEAEPLYANDIFTYFREKELTTRCSKYMEKQPHLNDRMRSVLIDWLVEVQQSFGFVHETLYTCVKIVDHFLMRATVTKERFQLLGLTAMLIASKIEECFYPLINDFIFLCDDAYNRDEILQMEMQILSTLDFQLNYPLSYSFLRRYARTSVIPIDILTLARYILESSLLSYSFVDVLDSKISAASLLLALKMKKMSWNPTLTYYCGYAESELLEIMYKLNTLIATPSKFLVIKKKYSDSVFGKVALIAPLPISDK